MYPGQKIRLEIVGYDQFQHPTYVIARVSDSRGDINSGAFSQTTDDNTTHDRTVGCPCYNEFITTCACSEYYVQNSVTFEPALHPIIPSNRKPEVFYRVPKLAAEEMSQAENITVIVDTPYNVIDVS